MPPWTADTAVGINSAIHFTIAFGEIFLWNRVYPHLKQFAFSEKEAANARPIVANVGLYNAFIATGLLWSLAAGNAGIRYFFLFCVAAAGVFGAATLKTPKTLALQTLPALIAIVLMRLSRP